MAISTPPPHRQSLTEAAIAALSSGAVLAGASQYVHGAFPAQYAAVATVIVAVLAFARKELPYAIKFWHAAVVYWNALRKDKHFAKIADQLTAYEQRKQAAVVAEAKVVEHAVPAPVVAAVTAEAKAAEAAVTAPTPPVTPPAAPGPLSSLGM